jgi:hypothetical protein
VCVRHTTRVLGTRLCTGLGDQYHRVPCGSPPPGGPWYPLGAVNEAPSVVTAGPAPANGQAFVSAMLCLTDDCTKVVIGGHFNRVLGVWVESVAILEFDAEFHNARR